MIEYEKMNSSHIDGMVAVEKECFGSGFARKTFERELENKLAVYLVALLDGEIVGYAGAWNICGEVDIMNVGVSKAARRRGIASGLLRRLLIECRTEGVCEVNLEVRKGNTAARELYQKLGFCEVGLRKGYYDGKEDAVLMKFSCLEENTDENTCN